MTPQRAPKKNYAPLLCELLERCRIWDDPQLAGVRSLRAAHRAQLLDDIAALTARQNVGKPSLWHDFRRRFLAPVDVHTAERAVLQTFERLCEQPLPLHVSSVLLRHYGALRRAALASESHRSGPPAPPPNEPRLDLAAVAH